MNLDVFILTYNRADLLRETLESLAAQTYQDFTIVVVDNASTDNTVEIVNEFSRYRQAHLHRHPYNIGGVDNFHYVGRLAKAKWVMAFHDDDIMHPRYIEYAMNALSKNPECYLIASNYVGVKKTSQEALAAQKLNNDHWSFDHAAHFASFCYTINKIHFGSTIYQTERLRSLHKENLLAFGKIADRPAMIETLRAGGGAIVFKAPFIQYREHANQDSQTSTSGPFLHEAIALAGYYAEVMGKTWQTSSGRSFIVNNRAYLKGLYKWCSDRSSKCFNHYVWCAKEVGAASYVSFLPRLIMRLVKKILLKIDFKFF